MYNCSSVASPRLSVIRFCGETASGIAGSRAAQICSDCPREEKETERTDKLSDAVRAGY